jgi:hypothetical protein
MVDVGLLGRRPAEVRQHLPFKSVVINAPLVQLQPVGKCICRLVTLALSYSRTAAATAAAAAAATQSVVMQHASAHQPNT